MVTRLIYGGRLSLFMGVLPVACAFVIGSTLGIFAGYVGGWVNMVVMRVIDVFYAFPSVLLAIALSGALGAGITNAVVSLTIVFVPPITRVAESVTTQIRTRDYVEAARVSGAGAFTIIRVHVLGNVLGPIFVYATSLISVSMILASGLSFLGSARSRRSPNGASCSTRCAPRSTCSRGGGAAGRDDLHHLDLLQPAVDGLRSAMEVRS